MSYVLLDYPVLFLLSSVLRSALGAKKTIEDTNSCVNSQFWFLAKDDMPMACGWPFPNTKWTLSRVAQYTAKKQQM